MLKMEWKALKNLKRMILIYVFLDVMMPYKDGFTLSKRNKRQRIQMFQLYF